MIYSDAIDYPLEAFDLPQQHSLHYLDPLPASKRDEARRLIEEEAAHHQYDRKEYEKSYDEALRHIHVDYKNKKVTVAEKEISNDEYEKQKFTR